MAQEQLRQAYANAQRLGLTGEDPRLVDVPSPEEETKEEPVVESEAEDEDNLTMRMCRRRRPTRQVRRLFHWTR